MFDETGPVVFLVVGLLAALIILFGSGRATQGAQRLDCINLNPKYGKTYAPNFGHFEDIKMDAVSFTDTTVGLVVHGSIDHEVRFFNCADLKAVAGNLTE